MGDPEWPRFYKESIRVIIRELSSLVTFCSEQYHPAGQLCATQGLRPSSRWMPGHLSKVILV